MNLYIVYQGEFSTDKPRNSMASPYIALVTNNKEEAIEKVREIGSLEIDWIDTIDVSETECEYTGDYIYGKVGIFEIKMSDFTVQHL